MSRKIVWLAGAVALASLSGCASPLELEERRQNAFDVSGEYQASGVSEAKLKLRVRNESGRHDIRVEALREADALTGKEVAFFKRIGADPEAVRRFFGNPLILGEGRQNELEGGENFSDDFGESSRLRVATRTHFQDGRRLQIHYTIAGQIRKSDFVLRGVLAAHAWEAKTEAGPDGKETTTLTHLGDVELPFDAHTDAAYFHRQYFGRWVGKVSLSSRSVGSLSELGEIRIRRLEGERFEVASGPGPLLLDGKPLERDSSPYPLAQLASFDAPPLELRFDAGGGRRVVFAGHIFSLGNLSGAIVLIDGADEEIIGSFVFHKD